MNSSITSSHWQNRITSFLQTAQEPLLVIVGPTASGKTSFSIDVAQWLTAAGKQAEIVNADSRQLYRFLTIGTAKISAEEMQGIPHHLIDVLNPDEEATAGWYQEAAEKVIGEIRSRGNIPMLVGGSMLYVSAITDALTFANYSDEGLRRSLTKEYEKDNGASLLQKLQELDSEEAAQIEPRNKHRLIRAVEICLLSEKVKSEAVPSTELRSKENRSKHDLLMFGIEWPRETLVDRINQRTAAMFSQGWIQEVQGLLKQGYGAEAPAMKSHGYREIIQFLTSNEPSTVKELQELIASKTRQYAKRQMTWWKPDTRIEWLSS